MSPSVPFQSVPHELVELLQAHGAETSDLYRALANNPQVLESWIAMAWGLRTRAITARSLREVMILRSAHVQGASYQWADHAVMAKAAGVTEDQIEAVRAWSESKLFDEPTMAALRLMDEMIAGDISDDTLALLQGEFGPAERVELIVTAGFYCMVPRVLNALRLNA